MSLQRFWSVTLTYVTGYNRMQHMEAVEWSADGRDDLPGG